jgi:hypothetical protein
MSRESPQNHSALPRSRVAEVIERSQEDALRQLRQAGIPETEALLVMQRYSAFALQVIRELDLVYREFEQLLANDPDRSQEHQAWLETKAGGMILTIEAFILELVAQAIDKAKVDYRADLSRPREVIDMPPSRPSLREEAMEQMERLLHNPMLYRSVGYIVWFLVWLLVTRSVIWAFGALVVTAVMAVLFQQTGLILSVTSGVLFFLLVLLSAVGVIR